VPLLILVVVVVVDRQTVDGGGGLLLEHSAALQAWDPDVGRVAAYNSLIFDFAMCLAVGLHLLFEKPARSLIRRCGT
jgi:hypothetical protein